MRPISDELKRRYESAMQTASNNADPKAEIVLSRATVPLVDDEYLESGEAASDSLFEGRASLAVRRMSGQKEPDRVYVAYIDGDGTHIEYSDLPDNLDSLSWTEVTHDIDAEHICIAFDGDSNLHTQDAPWIFFTEDGGELYAQKLGDAGSRTLIAEGSITAVSAIRSRAAALDGPSYGFLVFYVDAGAIYCIQCQSDGWSEPEAVEIGPSGVTWTDLAAFRTRDGRVGVQAKTSGGQVYELFSLPAPPASAVLFTSEDSSEFALSVVDSTKHWDGELQYSIDAKTWTVWDGTTALNSSGGKLYLRGSGNTGLTGLGINTEWTLTSGKRIRCVGNIENLLDWQIVASGQHPVMGGVMGGGCFSHLFYHCTSLVTPPELPATELSANCYQGMFSGCTSLVTAPELPATKLAMGCYDNMFSYCTSLTSAPALPATELDANCYRAMFFGCTALTSMPALPATTLTTRCYYVMFRGCTSLKISASQDSTYQFPYRIPQSGTGAGGSSVTYLMFADTGGTFTGTPDINTTYYTDHASVS